MCHLEKLCHHNAFIPQNKWVRFIFILGLVCFRITLWGEEYPTHPIQVIVPTTPGGSYDKIARLIQRDIQANHRLPEKLVIQNLPGAGGVFGTTRLKDASPDGYTIGLWGPGLITSKIMGSADYDHTAFDIIGATGYFEIGLGVQDISRFQSIEILLKSLKDEPGSVKIATNMGLPVHFFPLMFADAAGVDFRFVQVGGGVKRLASILGGHTDVSLFSVLEFENYKNEDPEQVGIKPILFFSRERSPKFPEVPTARELGYKLVLNESVFWLAPKGMPKEILDMLRSVFRDAMVSPELQAEFKAMGMEAEFVEASEAQVILDEIALECEKISAKKLEVLDVVPINFPRVIFIFTAVCAIALFFKMRSKVFIQSFSYKREPGKALMFLLIACLYIVGLPLVGFRWATILWVLLSGSVLCGFTFNRSYVAGMSAMSLVLGLGVFYLFSNAFEILLP
jgi:putative tricarboxylic transport membrane protein